MIRRTCTFADRIMREVLRDPVNLFFAIAFPVILLWMLHAINASMGSAGNPGFAIDALAPGIATFAPVFMALFCGMLLARDRTGAFLVRLFASPMTAADFLTGYTLPMLLIAMAQALVTFLAAMLLGFRFTWGTLAAVVLVVPIALLCGSVMSDSAVGGVCGALLTVLASWFAGIWFPIDVMGEGFKAVCDVLPFYHASQLADACVHGRWGELWPDLWPVLAWAAALYAVAVAVFAWRKRDR
ncbi:ABC transporter permease [Bifidobacterium cuniculi]|uniref:ABC superfamily ATP binding cassette transporter permease n=1 Tax=Bifidobacterium cuniculi TaxID=1688 RepID=A0A087AVY5_9BIFI|nr:ABC transporter permease [Bifidobacterium cuniculi]KFI62935.1 ABC superfamily ATP binding cassette transporter permease [Bifidobacterium cuniculi]